MRRLVAIMFTDIEGYTSLMQNNESQAILTLDRYKQVVINQVRHFDGRLIKFMGDGTLSIFSSSFQAVSCAISLQQELRKDKIIPVRIGIHQGEVIIEHKDVVGDAVNLSSRIQNAGVSGSVLISQKVHDELNNHPEINSVHLGAFLLKNVSLPLNLFAVKSEGLLVPGKVHAENKFTQQDKYAAEENETLIIAEKRKHSRWPGPVTVTVALSVLLVVVLINGLFDKKENPDEPRTIAVLPFKNIGIDAPESIYLSEALTEEVVNILSSNLRLKVRKIATRPENDLSPSVAGLFPGKNLPSILDCSVQKVRDSLKIFASLRSGDKNEVMWNRTYVRPFYQQLSLQQNIAQEIADALETSYTKDEMRALAKQYNIPDEAYKLYLLGRHEQNKRDSQSMQSALTLFRKAVGIFPGYAQAWAAISDNYTIRLDNGLIPYDTAYKYAKPALEKATQILPDIPEMYASKGIFMGSVEGKHKEALRALSKATELRSNDAFIHQYYAVELMADGKLNEALDHINESIALEPQLAPRQLGIKNSILMQAKRFDEARVVQYELLQKFNDTARFNVQCAERYYRMGLNDSVYQIAKLIHNDPKDQLFWNAVLTPDKTSLRKRLTEDPGYTGLEIQAFYLTCLNDYKNAMDKIEAAYNAREYSWLKFLNVDPDWEPLRKEPRFTAMLQKLDLN